MQITTVGTFPITIGWVIALLVLIIAVVLLVITQIDQKLGAFIIGLALARLL